MAQAPRRRRPPRLDEQVLDDEDALTTAHAELFAANPTMLRHKARVLKLQDRLRKLVDDRAWSAFLDFEEAEGARLFDAVDLVTRWAFREGRKRRP